MIVITGGNSGLGQCIIQSLSCNNKKTLSFDIGEGDDVRDYVNCADFLFNKLDVFNGSGGDELEGIINCAGINHIDYLEDLEEKDWDRLLDTNAKGIYNMSRAALPYLKKTKGFILNIISNASHMPMTSSLAYNASKGAAHIMTLQMARELTRRHGITVFGISPNKLSGTGMSNYIDERVPEQRGWTKEQAKQYQINSLLTGEETDPQVLADFIAYLLEDKRRHKYLSGCILPYGA